MVCSTKNIHYRHKYIIFNYDIDMSQERQLWGKIIAILLIDVEQCGGE
jgi:hypothetical protein